MDRDLRATIKSLWHDLAGNPNHRAQVIARVAANRGDANIQAWVHDLIEFSTILNKPKQQALDLLQADVETQANQKDWSSYTVRVDPELGRLAIVVKWAHLFRLWVISRDLSKEKVANGDGIVCSGKITRKALKSRLSAIGSRYTQDHLNRLIRRGEGIFWNASRSHLYLRKPTFVAQRLVERVVITAPTVISSNLPGVRDVYLSPLGSLEQWEATLYAGWHCHRENPTIARSTLARLFGRTEQTLRNWEQRQLQEVVTPRHNYAQAPITESLYDFYPEHAQRYATKAGDVRVTWQLPNTYLTRTIRQHPHHGQAYKVRQIVKLCLEDCTATIGGMQRSASEHPAMIRRNQSNAIGRLYFDDSKRLQRYLRRHGGIRYLWRGERCYTHTRHGIFEATDSGLPETNATERLGFKAEYDLLSQREY